MLAKAINLGLKLTGARKWWTILGAVISLLILANVWQFNRGQTLELKLQSCSDEKIDKDNEITRMNSLISSQTRLGGQALTATEKECLDETQAAYDAGRNSALPDGVRLSPAELQRRSAWVGSVPAKRTGEGG